MTFLVNNSPFAGREGKWVTRGVEERLQALSATDVFYVLNQLIHQTTDCFITANCTLSIPRTWRLWVASIFVQKLSKEIDGINETSMSRSTHLKNIKIHIQSPFLNARVKCWYVSVAGNGQTSWPSCSWPVVWLGINWFYPWLVVTGLWTIPRSIPLPLIPGEINATAVLWYPSERWWRNATHWSWLIEERGTILGQPRYWGSWRRNDYRWNSWLDHIGAGQMTNVRSATKDQTAVNKTPRIFDLRRIWTSI